MKSLDKYTPGTEQNSNCISNNGKQLLNEKGRIHYCELPARSVIWMNEGGAWVQNIYTVHQITHVYKYKPLTAGAC